ncbi:MAG: hypothetical protein ACOYOB_06525 [Myxococcota bacterium]
MRFPLYLGVPDVDLSRVYSHHARLVCAQQRLRARQEATMVRSTLQVQRQGLATGAGRLALAAVALGLWTASCGGAGFERMTANKYRSLPVGTVVRIAAAEHDLPQPTVLVGVLRTTTKGDPADRPAAEETLKKFAARYGCDAVAEIVSIRREVKSTRRNKTLGANGVPVYIDEVVINPEHDWEGRCIRTADAPVDPVTTPGKAQGTPTGGKSSGNAADRAAAERASADRSAAQKALAERKAADKEAAERASADRATAEKALADRAAAERALAARAAAERAAAEKAAGDRPGGPKVDYAAVERAAAERAAAEQAAADKAAAEKALADRGRGGALERAAAERAAAEKAADKTDAERAAADKAAAEKATAERIAAERVSAERAAAERAAAEKAAAAERPVAPPAETYDPKIASEVARAFIAFSDWMVRANVDKLCAAFDDTVAIDITAGQPKMRIKQEFTTAEACESVRNGELANYVRDLGPAEVHADVATLIPTLFGIHRGAYLRLDDQQQKKYSEELTKQREGKKPLACTMYNVVPAGELFRVSLTCTGVANFRLLLRRAAENNFKIVQFSHSRQ